MSDSKNLVRKMFVGRNATEESNTFVAEIVKSGHTYDSTNVVGSTVQVNYYVNETSTAEDEVVKVEIQPVESIELVDMAEDIMTALDVEEPTEETDVLVPDWGYAESLEDKADVEAYLAEFGFNATSTWKKSTMIKKAKEHFGE